MKRKVQATVLVVGLLVAAVLGLRGVKGFLQPSGQRMSNEAKRKGNPAARIKIVEYTDFQCPACAQGAKKLADYVASHEQDVLLEYRPFPLTPRHQHAFRAAVFAECSARQGKFWPVHDLLFSRQNEWSAGGALDEILTRIVQEAGVDAEALARCLADPTASAVVMKQKEEGADLGVQATPTYFLNDKRVVGVSQLLEALKAP